MENADYCFQSPAFSNNLEKKQENLSFNPQIQNLGVKEKCSRQVRTLRLL